MVGGALNRRRRRPVVTADQGGDLAPQLAQEGAGEIGVIIGDFDEGTGAGDDAVAVVVVEEESVGEDRQAVDDDPQVPCPSARVRGQGIDVVAPVARMSIFNQLPA